MTVLLFLLAGVWVAFLLPPYLRKRSERTVDSISSFRQQLSILERTGPGLRAVEGAGNGASRAPAAPFDRRSARRRRRDVLLTLTGAAILTLVLTVTLGGPAIVFHVAADVLLVAYVYLLVQVRKSQAERAVKVRFLPAPAVAPQPTLLVRRSASN